MKIICLLTAFTFLSFSGVPEDACLHEFMSPHGEGEGWGIGACKIPSEVQIPVYTTDQKSFGYLLKNEWFIYLYDHEGKELQQLGLNEVAAIGHISKAFVKVRKWKNSAYYWFDWTSENGGFLLKKEDLASQKAPFYSYEDLLLRDEISQHKNYNSNGTPIGVNLLKSCLNLRKEPTATSEKITCVPGNDWESELKTRIKIKKTEGSWALVEVAYLKRKKSVCDPEAEWCCDEYPVQYTKQGWIQFIDARGFPNIWFDISYSGF